MVDRKIGRPLMICCCPMIMTLQEKCAHPNDILKNPRTKFCTDNQHYKEALNYVHFFMEVRYTQIKLQ